MNWGIFLTTAGIVMTATFFFYCLVKTLCGEHISRNAIVGLLVGIFLLSTGLGLTL